MSLINEPGLTWSPDLGSRGLGYAEDPTVFFELKLVAKRCSHLMQTELSSLKLNLSRSNAHILCYSIDNSIIRCG